MSHATVCRFVLGAGLIALAGCASAAARPGESLRYDQQSVMPVLTGGAKDHIAHAELVSAPAKTLDEAIRRLRPEFLRPVISTRLRGTAERPSVYVDDSYVGGADVLALYNPETVIDVSWLSPVSAQNRFGSSCSCASGVILVRLRSTGR